MVTAGSSTNPNPQIQRNYRNSKNCYYCRPSVAMPNQNDPRTGSRSSLSRKKLRISTGLQHAWRTNNLRSTSTGKAKKVIELDIEKCSERFNYQTSLDQIIASTCIKIGLRHCLKIGACGPEYPEQATPQGGGLSPRLANSALKVLSKFIHQPVTQTIWFLFESLKTRKTRF